MKKTHGLRHNENHAKKKSSISDDFGLKEPRHSVTISDENCSYLYRSTRQLKGFQSIARDKNTTTISPVGIQRPSTIIYIAHTESHRVHGRREKTMPVHRPVLFAGRIIDKSRCSTRRLVFFTTHHPPRHAHHSTKTHQQTSVTYISDHMLHGACVAKKKLHKKIF